MGAANDLAFTGSVVDTADREFIGVGMGIAGEDLCDDDALEIADERMDGFDFEAEHGEAFGEVGGRVLEVDVAPEPIEGDLHQNCWRKRTSFS
jgi:hypothetical protein